MARYDVYKDLGLDRSQDTRQIAAAIDKRRREVDPSDLVLADKLATAAQLFSQDERRSAYDALLDDPAKPEIEVATFRRYAVGNLSTGEDRQNLSSSSEKTVQIPRDSKPRQQQHPQQPQAQQQNPWQSAPQSPSNGYGPQPGPQPGAGAQPGQQPGFAYPPQPNGWPSNQNGGYPPQPGPQPGAGAQSGQQPGFAYPPQPNGWPPNQNGGYPPQPGTVAPPAGEGSAVGKKIKDGFSSGKQMIAQGGFSFAVPPERSRETSLMWLIGYGMIGFMWLIAVFKMLIAASTVKKAASSLNSLSGALDALSNVGSIGEMVMSTFGAGINAALMTLPILLFLQFMWYLRKYIGARKLSH